MGEGLSRGEGVKGRRLPYGTYMARGGGDHCALPWKPHLTCYFPERTTGFDPRPSPWQSGAHCWCSSLPCADVPISLRLGTVQHYSLHVVLPISSQELYQRAIARLLIDGLTPVAPKS